MSKWHITKPKTRTIIGLILIIGFFIWITYLFNYFSVTYPHSTPDKLSVWLGMMVACLLLLLGITIGAGENIKRILVGYLFLFVWSIGFLILPIPEGYGESVLGSWAVLGMTVVFLYFEYEKYKKKRRSQKGTGTNETH